MNKHILLLIGFAAIVAFALLIFLPGESPEEVLPQMKNTVRESQSEEEILGERQLRISWDNHEIVVDLEENSTVDDLVASLPMTVSLEDYNNTEKIAYLDNELSQASEGYTPKRGDVAYYVPWPNISICYNDFTYSDSLVKLGEISKDLDLVENLDDQEVTIE